jgi:3-deoxy-D-manno-octulosonate 8-phosphate phosphatase (KDO 8-P phosphatase)
VNQADNISARARDIKLVVFDVDGVLTDGGLILGESGDEYKIFHVRDGQGLVMLRESGCLVAVITARSSKIVAERMVALGIEHVFQGQNNKGEALIKLMSDLGISRQHTAYVGDDILDLPAMRLAGFAIAVADAHPVVQENADWITSAGGGHGAAREVCEMIMQAQGTLQPFLQRYL